MKITVTFDELHEHEEEMIHSWIESSWDDIQDDPDCNYLPSEQDILKNFGKGEIVTDYAVVRYICGLIEDGLDLYGNGEMDKINLTLVADNYYESDLISDNPNLDHGMVIFEKFYCADCMREDGQFVCDLVDGTNRVFENIGKFDSLEECQKAVNRHYRKGKLW